jgi:transcriptional regulator with XRE-family HTH domain
MDDMRIGAAFRAVRLRRHWRQSDVAERAGVSQSLVSLVERGHLDKISLATLRGIGRVLDVNVGVYARWRGGELDRMLSVRHSLLAESVATMLVGLPDWSIAPEVSFSIYGERGIIDILAFHAPTGCLLVIELKTAIIDVNELVGTLDRKARLAPEIARQRGWDARHVSRWVIVARDKTNLRRIEAHRSVLRAAFPDDGRLMRGWLIHPNGGPSALSTWSETNRGGTSPRSGQRVHVQPSAADPA